MEKGVKAIAVKFAIFGLISILLFVALYNTMTNNVAGKQHTLQADFTNVSGLREGDDVRISGVKVGRVETVEVKDNHLAQVTFTVQAAQQITDTTRVTMRYQNLLGQKYLALTPGKDRGERLVDGDTIELRNTDDGFDLTALLNGFEPLFNVLSPADMNTLAENIVAVLQGESGSVESLLAQTGDFTSFLADREDVFDEVVTNLTPVVENLASQSDQFDTALVEMRKLVAGLNDGSDEFFSAMRGIGGNLDSTSQLVNDLRPSVTSAIRQIHAFGDTLRRGTPIIEDAFSVLPDMVGAFVRSMSYGSHLQVYNCAFGIRLVGENPIWLGRADGPHSEACK